MSRRLRPHLSRQERLSELLSDILDESGREDEEFDLDVARRRYRELLHTGSVADATQSDRELSPKEEGEVEKGAGVSEPKGAESKADITYEKIVEEEYEPDDAEIAYRTLADEHHQLLSAHTHAIEDIKDLERVKAHLLLTVHKTSVENDDLIEQLARSREYADELAERLHNLDIATGINPSPEETVLDDHEESDQESEADTEDESVEQNPNRVGRPNHNNMAFKRAIKPRLFHGFDEEDGREFVRAFEDFCSLEEVGEEQEEQKLKLFKLLMRGVASVWVTQLPEEAYRNYDELKALFTKRYIDPFISGSRLSEETRLRSRKLQKSETVYALYTDLVTRGSKLGKTDRDLLTYFIDAVPNEYKTMIIAADPDTLDKAVKIAQSAEAIYGPREDSEGKLKKGKPTLSVLKAMGGTEESEEDEVNAILGPMLNAIKGLQEQIGKLSTQGSETQTNSAEKSVPQKTNRNPDKPLTCYGCGKPGHIRRECRSTRGGRGRGRGRGGWTGNTQWQPYPQPYNQTYNQGQPMQGMTNTPLYLTQQPPVEANTNQATPVYLTTQPPNTSKQSN